MNTSSRLNTGHRESKVEQIESEKDIGGGSEDGDVNIRDISPMDKRGSAIEAIPTMEN